MAEQRILSLAAGLSESRGSVSKELKDAPINGVSVDRRMRCQKVLAERVSFELTVRFLKREDPSGVPFEITHIVVAISPPERAGLSLRIERQCPQADRSFGSILIPPRRRCCHCGVPAVTAPSAVITEGISDVAQQKTQ